jgi:streptogrisin C
MRLSATLTIAIAMAAGFTAAPALAEERPDGSLDALAAIERDLGLSPERALEIGRRQDRAIELDAELQASLGTGYAGARFDVRRGVLIVNVSDASLVEAVTASGAEPRLVARSLRELEAITTQLNGPRPDALRRRVIAQPRNEALTSSYIDPASNTVRATVNDAGAAKALASRYGDAITVTISAERPELLDRPMDGGDGINTYSCSAGFNLRNPSTGQRFLLTAGHCVSSGSTLKGHGPVNFGPVLESWFPYFDDALARNTNTAYWTQGPWVDLHAPSGSVIETRGFTDAPVGTIVCKSGISTQWTCGLITAKDVSVTYVDGSTVHGLTRHSACAEHGDSGGSTVSFSFTHKWRAEGVTSGGRARKKNGWPRCLEVFGEENESFYFPIANSLAYYGPRYGVTTW